MKLVERLEFQFDIPRLQEEVTRLSAMFPFHREDHQIALNHRPGAADPFYDGVGSLYHRPTETWLGQETDFTELNPLLKSWYLGFVYEEIQRAIPVRLGRVRLIRLGPKACLSMHYDFNLRIHLPIFTNPQCFFIFGEHPPKQLSADGDLYGVNTLIPHSVMNGHVKAERIHMVVAIDSTDPSIFETIRRTRSSLNISREALPANLG